jgi:hypothetical protein
MRCVYLMQHLDSDSDAERVFSARAGLHAEQETSFASSYGQLRDRFGINSDTSMVPAKMKARGSRTIDNVVSVLTRVDFPARC